MIIKINRLYFRYLKRVYALNFLKNTSLYVKAMRDIDNWILRICMPFPRGGEKRGAPLNEGFTVREKNLSQANKLERDSKRRSFIYSHNL